jgi:lipopolysaccharide transport system permease protein
MQYSEERNQERAKPRGKIGSVPGAQRNPDPSPVTIIIPPAGRVRLQLGELWEYRDLLYFLIWRDMKVRYKQTIIGATWAILQPLLTMVVFSVLFGRLFNVSTGEIPYPIFAYSALVPWTYFTHALTKSTYSMVADQALITKVYIPRLILPLAAVLAGFVDFVIALIILFFLMFYYKLAPTLAILTLPLFTLLTIATAWGVSLWLAPLNAEYRDIANALPFLTQLWLFATPIAYPSNLIPERWRVIYGLNPMVGVVEGFRWALLGSANQSPGPMLAVSAVAVVVLLVSGLYFFRRKEETLADVV